MKFECDFCNPGNPCVFDYKGNPECKPDRCPISPEATGEFESEEEQVKEWALSEKGDSKNSPSSTEQQTNEAITLLKECVAIHGQVHRQEWFINNKSRINAVIA